MLFFTNPFHGCIPLAGIFSLPYHSRAG
jgi:hypothetical protein